MNATNLEGMYPNDACYEPIQKLLHFVKEGNSAQIIGLPGVGKSNFLKLLIYNRGVYVKHLGNNNSFHFVYLSFTELRSKPLQETTKYIFLSILDSLSKLKMDVEYEKIHNLFKENLVLQDELLLFNALKKAVDFLANDNKLTLVFLCDRFEEYLPSINKEFFAELRALRDIAKYRFSVVFALNRPLEDVVDAVEFADYYEFLAGHIIYLPLYDKLMQEFRIDYLQKAIGKEVDKSQLKQIFELTGRHSKLTRVALEACLNEQNSKDNFIDFLLSQKSIIGVLYEIWNALTPAEQKHLFLMQSDNPPTDSHEYLIKTGLLSQQSLNIPLIIPFMKQIIPENDESQDYNFNEHNNTINKGGQCVSDLLTRAEFRLLKLLIIHKNEIVDREQIIQAVWSDSKSTAGVTDQALDQLIFRLRKKIEENVNSPKHLLTVKGRGFRLIP